MDEATGHDYRVILEECNSIFSPSAWRALNELLEYSFGDDWCDCINQALLAKGQSECRFGKDDFRAIVRVFDAFDGSKKQGNAFKGKLKKFKEAMPPPDYEALKGSSKWIRDRLNDSAHFNSETYSSSRQVLSAMRAMEQVLEHLLRSDDASVIAGKRKMFEACSQRETQGGSSKCIEDSHFLSIDMFQDPWGRSYAQNYIDLTKAACEFSSTAELQRTSSDQISSIVEKMLPYSGGWMRQDICDRYSFGIDLIYRAKIALEKLRESHLGFSQRSRVCSIDTLADSNEVYILMCTVAALAATSMSEDAEDMQIIIRDPALCVRGKTQHLSISEINYVNRMLQNERVVLVLPNLRELSSNLEDGLFDQLGYLNPGKESVLAWSNFFSGSTQHQWFGSYFSPFGRPNENIDVFCRYNFYESSLYRTLLNRLLDNALSSPGTRSRFIDDGDEARFDIKSFLECYQDFRIEHVGLSDFSDRIEWENIFDLSGTGKPIQLGTLIGEIAERESSASKLEAEIVKELTINGLHAEFKEVYDVKTGSLRKGQIWKASGDNNAEEPYIQVVISDEIWRKYLEKCVKKVAAIGMKYPELLSHNFIPDRGVYMDSLLGIGEHWHQLFYPWTPASLMYLPECVLTTYLSNCIDPYTAEMLNRESIPIIKKNDTVGEVVLSEGIVDEVSCMLDLIVDDVLAADACKGKRTNDAVISTEKLIESVPHDANLDFKGIAKEIKGELIGQDKIVDSVIKTVRGGVLGKERNPDKPYASFIFAGTTGTGKTELAKLVAEKLSYELVRIDMSELKEEHAIARLIGAPPGYAGMDEGQLMRIEDDAVILFDEIEKAHPDIMNIFLQILDRGGVTSNTGKYRDLSKCIIIATTNLGASEYYKQGKSVGFASAKKDITDDEFEKLIRAQVKDAIRLEVYNRFDAIEVFQPLSSDVARQIANNYINKSILEWSESRLRLEVSEAVREIVFRVGYSKELGARELRRAVKRIVVDPIWDYYDSRKGEQALTIGSTMTIADIESNDDLDMLEESVFVRAE